jgi:hypothetical protein
LSLPAIAIFFSPKGVQPPGPIHNATLHMIIMRLASKHPRSAALTQTTGGRRKNSRTTRDRAGTRRRSQKISNGHSSRKNPRSNLLGSSRLADQEHRLARRESSSSASSCTGRGRLSPRHRGRSPPQAPLTKGGVQHRLVGNRVSATAAAAWSGGGTIWRVPNGQVQVWGG